MYTWSRISKYRQIMNDKDWSKGINIAITVSDTDGNILYMNDRSAETFKKYGGLSLIGSNLKECHKPESWSQITEMIITGSTNVYTIEKEGKKKLIYQTPWYSESKVAGLVELSLELPHEMAHHKR